MGVKLPSWSMGLRGAPLLAVLLLSALLSACARSGVRGARPSGAVSIERLHVLMINGGGEASENYQSHVLHLQTLLADLEGAGLPAERIAVFSSDGDDPGADMAIRDPKTDPRSWLVEGTALERALRPVELTNTTLPGISPKPATRAAITRWFADAGARLRPGDTLLLYVTDHGTQGEADPLDNRITLWGKKQSLSVRELRSLLGRLDPRVRVVALMSQCYSGGFARLYEVHARHGRPSGAYCGYFSSTADRPAYGCYPENLGKDNVGHSFAFLRALGETRAFFRAHEDVLVSDQTPDVPLRTSDVYLEELLDGVARSSGKKRDVVVDGLLRQARRASSAWEPELRQIDAVARAFGLFGPRTLTELEAQAGRLPELTSQIRMHSRAWREAFADIANSGIERFLAHHQDWKARLTAVGPRALPRQEARRLTDALLGDLLAFLQAEPVMWGRLDALKDKRLTSAGLSYRMEVRLAAVLRLRGLMTTLAGRLYLATQGTAEQRAGYEALRACEDLRLPGAPAPQRARPTPEPLPSLEDEVRLAQEVFPAYLGIRFDQVPAELRERFGVGGGASRVVLVFPGSPAQVAGLEAGDVVIGTPGRAFTERNQIRSWTFLSRPDEPQALEILREGTKQVVTVVPKPFPLQWPSLPGPPKVGSAAPALKVKPYRGVPPASLVGNGSHLVFFWASWCGPCKASLPEVIAFARQKRVPVIAITDEEPDALDEFFAKFNQPFPHLVVIDELRQAFVSYGVNGVPTFVLVDGEGKVAGYQTGYLGTLGLPGWTWRR
jgi:thiol-disulfide isomerase/thioredoxin